jgi:small basic protein
LRALGVLGVVLVVLGVVLVLDVPGVFAKYMFLMMKATVLAAHAFGYCRAARITTYWPYCDVLAVLADTTVKYAPRLTGGSTDTL